MSAWKPAPSAEGALYSSAARFCAISCWNVRVGDPASAKSRFGGHADENGARGRGRDALPEIPPSDVTPNRPSSAGTYSPGASASLSQSENEFRATVFFQSTGVPGL